jgi:hypothetical protein
MTTRKAYPHLTTEVSVNPWFEDLLDQYGRTRDPRLRDHIRDQYQAMQKWLITHGLECGRDYQATDSGYRFATPAQALMFVLANSHRANSI